MADYLKLKVTKKALREAGCEFPVPRRPARFPIAEKRRQKMIQMAREGKTRREMAEVTGVCLKTAQDHVARSGVYVWLTNEDWKFVKQCLRAAGIPVSVPVVLGRSRMKRREGGRK